MPATLASTTAHSATGAPGPDQGPNPAPPAHGHDAPVRGPVLLATDGRSDESAASFRAAAAVAGRLGTSVEVLGVLDALPGYMTPSEVLAFSPELEMTRLAALQAAIDRQLETLGAGGARWPVTIEHGEPARTIVAHARDRDSTMIVVGAGRHELRDRVFGGEHALRVVRGTNRPVLAVRSDFRELPAVAVAGVDASPASARAARAALMLLPAGGRLVLVNVRPDTGLPVGTPAAVGGDADAAAPSSRWLQAAQAATGRLFEQLRDELRPWVPPGVTVETRAVAGSVLRSLVAVADEVGAGLLAVGTHGPGVLERLFVGSVATDALREAGRTVIVAPAPDAIESARLELRLRGATEVTEAGAWEPALAAFTKRNLGRRVRVEIDDAELGVRLQDTGFALLGATYDRHDRTVELMVGDPVRRTTHLTRSIPRADDLAFYAGDDGRDRALRVGSGRGQTILTFLD